MDLDLAALPEGSSDSEFTESLEHLLPDSDTCRYNHPVRVHLSAQKTQDEVIVNGRTRGHAEATCVRCLDVIPVEIDESFRVVVNLVLDEDRTDDTGDDDFVQVRRSSPLWDFTDLVRETLLLSVPENPLCRPDCAGLCGGCGRNLNHEACACQSHRPSGPFANLKEKLESARTGAMDKRKR